MNKKLIFVGSPILREIALPVDAITNETKAIVKNMKSVMSEECGAGLAAPQIGINQRIFIFTEPGDHPKIHICINPEVTEKSNKQIEMEEGCLSIQSPDGPVFAPLARSETITATWKTLDGKTERRKLSGVSARAFLHELDHLNGILFIDYLSDIKREMVMSKARKRK